MRKFSSLTLFFVITMFSNSLSCDETYNLEEERINNSQFDEFMSSIEWSEMLQDNGILDEDFNYIEKNTIQKICDPILTIDLSDINQYYQDEVDYYYNNIGLMNYRWTFEECMSSLGLCICRVALGLEEKTGKPSSVIHRELISRSFIQSRFNLFNEKIIELGGDPLNIKDFDVIHERAIVYMEKFYHHGLYAKSLMEQKDKLNWNDLVKDDMEAIFYVQGLAGGFIMIIPGCAGAGFAVFSSAVMEYLAYQVIKQERDKKGAVPPPKTPTKDLDEKFILETQGLNQY